MAKLFGRFKGLSADFYTDKAILQIEVDDKAAAGKLVDDLNGYQLDIHIGKHHEHRSLDANAYLWVLLGKIANKLTIPKDKAYLNALKRYGQCGVVKVRNNDIEKLKRMFKYIEPHEDAREPNVQYFKFFVGSSVYNSDEFSKLLDGVIYDAKQLGIETATPEELAMMKEEWK